MMYTRPATSYVGTTLCLLCTPLSFSRGESFSTNIMSFLTTRLLPHRLPAATIPIFSTATAAGTSPSLSPAMVKSNFHTSAPLLRPGYKPERNPKIGITLEQLRMAARGQGRRLPICHEQQEKVMNSLEAAKYEVCVVCVSWCCLCANIDECSTTSPSPSQYIGTESCYL